MNIELRVLAVMIPVPDDVQIMTIYDDAMQKRLVTEKISDVIASDERKERYMDLVGQGILMPHIDLQKLAAIVDSINDQLSE